MKASSLPSVDGAFLVLVLVLVVVLVVVVGWPTSDGIDDIVVVIVVVVVVVVVVDGSTTTGAVATRRLRSRRRREGRRGRGRGRGRRGGRGRRDRRRGRLRRRGWQHRRRGGGGDVSRGGSDSGQGVRVASVMSQARRRAGDGGRRGRARGGDAGRVMVERALVILLMMMIRHVHRPGGVGAGVHAVVVMVSGWRRVRVRVVRRAEVGVALMQLLVHLHLGRLGVLGAGRGAGGVARQ